MLLLNILSYSVCDLWFSNTAVSIIFTYIVNEVVVRIRGYLGQLNIAAKTMVDERFLI